MRQPQLDANQFDLWGRGVHVSYSTSSIEGRPRFTYSAFGKKKTFAGDEIRLSENGLGRLVSVTLEVVPDLRTETFSIILPQIVGDEEARFRTVGIHTVALTSIGGPQQVKGALASYEATELVGVARSVQF